MSRQLRDSLRPLFAPRFEDRWPCSTKSSLLWLIPGRGPTERSTRSMTVASLIREPNIRHSPEYSPLAGAVAPAAERFRAAKMLGYVVRFQCSFPHQHERSHQIPDHVVQKSTAPDGVNQFFVFASTVPGRSEDSSDI